MENTGVSRRTWNWPAVSGIAVWAVTVWVVLSLYGRQPWAPGAIIIAIFVAAQTGRVFRSEWKGVMAGSVCALILHWFAGNPSTALRGAEYDARIVTICCLLPVLAGFWGQWLARFFEGGQSREQRLPAMIVAVGTIGVLLWGQIFHNTTLRTIGLPLSAPAILPAQRLLLTFADG